MWSCGTGTGWRLSGSSGDRSGARVSTRAPETAAVDPARVHGPRPGAVPPDRSVPASRPQEPTTAPSGTLPVQGNLPSPPADRPMAQPAETCGERPHGTTARPSDGPPKRGNRQVFWRATHERRPPCCPAGRPQAPTHPVLSATGPCGATAEAAGKPTARPLAEALGGPPIGATAESSDGPPARGDCQVLWRATHDRRPPSCPAGRPQGPTRPVLRRRALVRHRRGCRRTDREAARRGHRRIVHTGRPPGLSAGCRGRRGVRCGPLRVGSSKVRWAGVWRGRPIGVCVGIRTGR